MISAIPRRQVGKAKQNLGPKFSYSPDDTSFQVSSTKKVNLELKCKDFYWFFFINKVNPDLKPTKKWAHDLQLNGVELTGYFKTLTNFTFLHRIIVARN